MALNAARSHFRYLGFCHTEAHVEGLCKWLARKLWKDFKTEGTSHYEPGLVALLERNPAAED